MILFVWNLKYQNYIRVSVFILISMIYGSSLYFKTPMLNVNSYLMFLFILNAKFVDYDYFANVSLIVIGFTFVIVLFMFFIGIFPPENNAVLVSQTGTLRYSLGFMHPNTLGIFAFSFCSFLVLSADKSNFKLRYLLALIIFIIISYISASRGLEVSGIILIILLIIGKINFLKNCILKLSYLVPLMCAFLALYIPINYDSGNALYYSLNNNLSGRLYLQNFILKLYNFKIFGQQTPLIGSSTGLWLDNAYLKIIVSNGILIAFIFIVLFMYACIRSVKLNKYVLCCVIIALICGEMVESQLDNAFVYAIFVLAFTYNKNIIGEMG